MRPENIYNEGFGQYVPDYKPWCVQLEMVEGCNRRCWFCGLLSLTAERMRGTHFVELGLLHKVFTELNDWLPKIRVEINSHGEPTLHPQFLEALMVIRKAMPTASLNLQTNTEVWKDEAKSYIPAMFEAGLNTLVLNAYEPGLYDWWKTELERLQLTYVDYYWDNPKNLAPNAYYPPHKQIIFLWDDLAKMNTTHKKDLKHPNKKMHNSGGNSVKRTMEAKLRKPVRELPWAQKCSKVFREFILGYDGTVPICCQDWQDMFVIGNAYEQTIPQIWNSERFWAVRQLLHRKRRDALLPCAGCNDPTTRVNLIHDPGLKETDEELLEVVRRTTPLSGKGAQAPIALEWEGSTIRL